MTSFFFHSGKGKVGVIRDLWSGEHKQSPALSPQAHMGCWIFPWLYIVETKANCLGIFSLFHSVGYATYDGIIILLDGLSFPTNLPLSLQ